MHQRIGVPPVRRSQIVPDSSPVVAPIAGLPIERLQDIDSPLVALQSLFRPASGDRQIAAIHVTASRTVSLFGPPGTGRARRHRPARGDVEATWMSAVFSMHPVSPDDQSFIYLDT